jgi:acyl-CoA thioester hydrolase
MTTAPAGFTYHIPIDIRYGDMDTLGHVNNAKYLTYIEQARIRYVREAGLWDGNISKVGVIIAKITMEYKLPLTMDDGTVDVWTRCSRIGGKSFDLENLIIRKDGAVAASAVTVCVVFDYQANVSVAVPEVWRIKMMGN